MRNLVFLFILISTGVTGQAQISNIRYFHDFIENNDTSLIMVGENHSSSVGSFIYPELIKDLNETHGTHNLLIEFGPSEAYFYTQYLKTGDEKNLAYTIYAGYYKDWKKAWRKIYEYNKGLAEPLVITGIDFDRGRTMAYALYNIFKAYDEKPPFIDSLMNVIKTPEFFETYTTGYPTEKDIEFKAETKKLFERNLPAIKECLSREDFTVVNQILKNEAIGYGGNREEAMAANTVRLMSQLDGKSYLMLIGRDHAYVNAIYDDNARMARLLKEEDHFATLAGVILHENSQQWGADYKKAITLFEIKNKIPWKYYEEEINARVQSDLTIIPFDNDLKELSVYTDYVITAFNKDPIEF